MRCSVVGVPDPLEQLPLVTARFMEALLANQLALAPAGHRQREVGGRAVLEDAVAVDPAPLDVLRVVEDDEDIHVRQQLEVAEVREEVRLHHGDRTFRFRRGCRSPPSQSACDRCADPLHSPLVEIDGKGKPEQAGRELLRHGERVRRATCVLRMRL